MLYNHFNIKCIYYICTYMFKNICGMQMHLDVPNIIRVNMYVYLIYMPVIYIEYR